MEAPSFSPISTLPNEILFDILKTAAYSGKAHNNILLVCKKWQEMAESRQFLVDKAREFHPRNQAPVTSELATTTSEDSQSTSELQSTTTSDDSPSTSGSSSSTHLSDAFVKKLSKKDEKLGALINTLLDEQRDVSKQHEIETLSIVKLFNDLTERLKTATKTEEINAISMEIMNKQSELEKEESPYFTRVKEIGAMIEEIFVIRDQITLDLQEFSSDN